MSARWTSQRVPAMGAIKGEGIKNQLGRPNLDPFVVLVREAAQNAWDAADENQRGPVAFNLELETFSGSTAAAWQQLLGQGLPSEEHLPLAPLLREPNLDVLFVSDRGTTGLGGPTRADEAREGEPHDYVSFVLNVGDPRDTDLGGGTYGFGKAVFFNGSRASTIVVHTRCRNASGVIESRLIGCALGPSFELGDHVFTGRHWFGVPASDSDVVEPLIGDGADAIAADLGFPPFEGDELGTSIAVVAPEYEDLSSATVAEQLALAIMWHLWPKMVDRGGGAPMRFRVRDHGEDVDVPDPKRHPVLNEFVAALEELEAHGKLVAYGAGRRPVGRMRIRTTFAPPPAIDDVGGAAGLDGAVHHCCLLRAPELVVEYRPGPRLPNPDLWYAGVFRAFDELDAVFAHAEPPTHDAWEAASLDGQERSLVRTTLRHIDDELREHAAPRVADVESGGGDGLAAMSRLLGHLLAPAPGQGAGIKKRGSTPVRPRPSSLKTAEAAYWDTFQGTDVFVQPFEVQTRTTITVDADASVRVWGGGGSETEPPLGGSEPRLLGWRDPKGVLHEPGRIAITGAEAGRWEALVEVPPDTAIRVRVREARDADSNG